uniref:ADF-H domain-containing protein n=1 Tax=Ciona savignyi TaxID=51511 RepID=H2ZQY3_CIOSA
MCAIDTKLEETSKKFSFGTGKTSDGFTAKIEGHTIVVDEEFNDITAEELAEKLPDHSPRYVMYRSAQKHSDGRTSYPICFLHYSPEGCSPEMIMKFDGCRNEVVKALGCTKVFALRDKKTLTEDWLNAQLSALP